MPHNRRILYLSYDGMTDPLGRSQVLPYLTGLAGRGHSISIVSFEKKVRTDADFAAIRGLCDRAGINWYPKRYHKRPPVLSTVYDLAQMTRTAAQLHERRGFDFVHCRSYIPAFVGLWLKQKYDVPFLFDMRGFWPEEKTEGGSWDLKNPLFRWIYRYVKSRERESLIAAAHIVSLTQSAKRELEARRDLHRKLPKISVIPCCVDLDLFAGNRRARGRAALKIDSATSVLVYLGSLGGNYMLGEMLDFFVTFRETQPSARFLFVTKDDAEAIVQAAEERGIGRDELLITAARRDEVPALLAAADLGIAFKQPSFSAISCSPTKIGEMLAMGIPVVANAGVGDVETQLGATGSGIIINEFTRTAYAAAIPDALALPRQRIRKTAERCFSLSDGIDLYASIYQGIGP